MILEVGSSILKYRMANELVEGSEAILKLNSTNRHTTIPMVPYYGVLNDYVVTVDDAPMTVEVIWAVLKFMIDNPNDPDYFEAEAHEHELQLTMNRAKQH